MTICKDNTSTQSTGTKYGTREPYACDASCDQR